MADHPILLICVFLVLITLNSIEGLLCLSHFCQNIDGCSSGDDQGRTVQCPLGGSCFLQVKIQVENGNDTVTTRAQGCATEWHYMKSENGSWTCFDGPGDLQRTCICSDHDLCNRQLANVESYHRLPLKEFPPPSSRQIRCVDSGRIYHGQSYCTYRKSNGSEDWIRRAHTTGYVTLLENSRRDYLCFQEKMETDCYCKTDLCNHRQHQGIFRPSHVGAFDEKVTCCQGERDHIPVSDTDRHDGTKLSYQCSSKTPCKGDYCFVRFKFNVIRRVTSLRQTCYNTSSELEFSHAFDGKEYGPYRERVLYCRRDFCNEIPVVFRSISAGNRSCVEWFLITGLLAMTFI